MAVDYVREVDMDDIAFIALSLFMDKTKIWTGDGKLREGVKRKGFEEIIGTPEVPELRKKLE